MPFHTSEYDVYVLLGDPNSEPLWYWRAWRQLIPGIDALVRTARGRALMRSTQYLRDRIGIVRFGKIEWKEQHQQKWTHLSPITLEVSPNWKFSSTELWAPACAQCEREQLAPDLFLSISSEGYFVRTLSFEPVVVAAVVRELAIREGTQVRFALKKMRELLNARLVAHQRRPWGRTALNGLAFSDSIQDLHVNGLFKPGRRHEQPLGLDLFTDAWDQVPGENS